MPNSLLQAPPQGTKVPVQSQNVVDPGGLNRNFLYTGVQDPSCAHECR